MKKKAKAFELACNRVECYKQSRRDTPEKTACRLFRVKYVDGVVFTECVRCGQVVALSAPKED